MLDLSKVLPSRTTNQPSALSEPSTTSDRPVISGQNTKTSDRPSFLSRLWAPHAAAAARAKDIKDAANVSVNAEGEEEGLAHQEGKGSEEAQWKKSEEEEKGALPINENSTQSEASNGGMAAGNRDQSVAVSVSGDSKLNVNSSNAQSTAAISVVDSTNGSYESLNRSSVSLVFYTFCLFSFVITISHR